MTGPGPPPLETHKWNTRHVTYSQGEPNLHNLHWESPPLTCSTLHSLGFGTNMYASQHCTTACTCTDTGHVDGMHLHAL